MSSSTCAASIGSTTESPNVVNSWHTTGIRTIEDVKVKELVVGAPGTATASVYYPKVMNAVIGTKFKIITGYPGGNDVNLAMERGEVGGRGSNSWASWKSTRPQWIAEKKIHILVQIGPRRHPELADVPLLTELTANDADRAVMQFMSADIVLSRAAVTTPETPPERVAALRRAFEATLQDPQFLAEADQAKMDISPVSAEQAQRAAASIIDTPPGVLARTKSLLESPTK
jgi:hypothetical protein